MLHGRKTITSQNILFQYIFSSPGHISASGLQLRQQRFFYSFLRSNFPDNGQEIASAIQVLELLSDLFKDIREQIQKKWQARSICNLINSLISYDNEVLLRTKGLRLLLEFIDIIAMDDPEKVNQAMLDSLQYSINLMPFCDTKHVDVSLLNLLKDREARSIDAFRFARKSRDTKKSDTIDMLKILFNFILSPSRTGTFSFWFQTLEQCLFKTLYPHVFDEACIGFDQCCPHQISALSCDFIITSLSTVERRNCIYSWKQSTSLALEILHQGFQLGADDASTINSALKIYNSWIAGKECPMLIHENPKFYLKKFISTISQVFTSFFRNPSSNQKQVEHVLSETTLKDYISLCESVVFTFRAISSESMFQLDQSSWTFLLESFIGLIDEILFFQIYPSHSLVEHLKNSTLSAFFDILFKSSIVSDPFWLCLKERCSSWLKSEVFVKIWASKVSSYTEHLILQITKADNDSFNDCFLIWERLLHIIEDPQKLSDSKFQTLLIKGVLVPLNMILEAINMPQEQDEANASKSKKFLVVRQHLPRGNVLFELFSPWLFAADIAFNNENEGLHCAILYSYCRLLMTRFDEPWADEYLACFFEKICSAAIVGTKSMQLKLLQQCAKLFSVGIYGIHILIPVFAYLIEQILSDSPTSESISDSVCIASSWVPLISNNPSISFLSNYSSVFKGLPRIEFRVKRYADLKPLVVETFFTGTRNQSEPILRATSLRCICVYIHCEMNRSLDSFLCKRMIALMLKFTKMSHEKIVNKAAIECIESLTVKIDDLIRVDKDLILFIFGGLVSTGTSVASFITQLSPSQVSPDLDVLLSDILYCTLEWLMVLPSEFQSDALSTEFFDLLFSCFAMKDSISEEHTLHLSSISEQSIHHANQAEFGELAKVAARDVLYHLSNNFGNFPLPCGPSTTVSNLEESDCFPMKSETGELKENPTSPGIHCIFGKNRLLSIHQFPCKSLEDEEHVVVRLTIRDMSGKYSWDFSPASLSNFLSYLRENSDFPIENDPKSEEHITRLMKRYSSNSQTSTRSSSSCFSIPTEIRGRVLLSEPEDSLDEVESDTLSEPRPILSLLLESGDSVCSKISIGDTFSDSEDEETALEREIIEDILQFDDQEDIFKPMHAKGYSQEDTASSENPTLRSLAMNEARLLLSHLGLLSAEMPKDELKLLENGSKLERSLRLLDRVMNRECHKIGVIYVAPGQESQEHILKNEGGPVHYESMIDALGWTVDVASHQGFLGGLDPHGSSGKNATYYASSTIEMIFHVATRMPTIWSDRQQIQKKRQVGNDHIHIVWSDHSRDYIPSTISSSFNNVHIVVSPLKNGLSRIQIFTKANVPPFGPLVDGMVVHQGVLGDLLRLTALNANRAVRYATPGYKRPYLARQKYIEDIIDRHQQKGPDSNVFAATFR